MSINFRTIIHQPSSELNYCDVFLHKLLFVHDVSNIHKCDFLVSFLGFGVIGTVFCLDTLIFIRAEHAIEPLCIRVWLRFR